MTDAADFVSVCHERATVTYIGVCMRGDLCHVTRAMQTEQPLKQDYYNLGLMFIVLVEMYL